MTGAAFEKALCKDFNRLTLKEVGQVWKSDGKIHITVNCPTVSFGKSVRVPVVMPRDREKILFTSDPLTIFLQTYLLWRFSESDATR